jgi:hypothetical protein
VELLNIVPGEVPHPVASLADTGSLLGINCNVVVLVGGVELKAIEVNRYPTAASINSFDQIVGDSCRACCKPLLLVNAVAGDKFLGIVDKPKFESVSTVATWQRAHLC